MSYFKTSIPLRARDSFFRDEEFSDCWDVMERQKKDFEQKCADSISARDAFCTGGSSSSKLFNSLDRRVDDFQYSPIVRRSRIYPASLIMMESDHLARKYSSGLGIHSDRENFKVSLDVQQFAPEELTVKTIDSTIIIEGKHEEKEDRHGIVSRHFQRKYTLPNDVKAEEVQCSFSADGRLHITAPRHLPAITSSKLNGTSKISEFDKTSAFDSHQTSDRTSFSKQSGNTSITDKFRDEMRKAQEDFDKSTSEMMAKSAERKDAFREEIRKAHEEFDKSTSSLFNRSTDRSDTRDDFRHSRLLRMFEPSFTAFPEFDPLPFWKRGRTSTLLEEFDKKSSLFDEFANSGRLSGQSSNVNTTLANRDIQQELENFKVIVDVHEFKPEELNVKAYDYFVEIEGRHEAKEDPHGFITRQFKRKYTLPRNVKATDVQCNLSSEGILVVTAPRQKADELSMHPHHVTIQQDTKCLQAQNQKNEAKTSNIINHQINSSSSNESRESKKIESSIPEEKAYQNVSSVHQIITERKEIPVTNTASHQSTSCESKTTTNGGINSNLHIDIGKTTGTNGGERIIPIDQESSHSNAGCQIEFPESRPDSSASSIPFDFSRGKSEEPISVASSTGPTFENLGSTTNTAPGERLIRINVVN